MKHTGRFVALLLSVCMLFGAGLGQRVAFAASNPFTDLPGGIHGQAITTLWEYGVVSGLEPDKFVPNGPVTRAQMAALIIRAMGKTSEAEMLKTVPNDFTDVADNHWARGVIAYASRAGIILGDGGKFFPNDPVNYAQAATMMVRALGYEKQVVGGYPSGYVLKANELGLLKDLAFDLYAGVNRAEAAILLYNGIFRAPSAKDGLTWSQTVFQRPASVKMEALPPYVAPGQQVPLVAEASDLVGKPIPGAPIQFRLAEGTGRIEGRTLIVGDGGQIKVEAVLGSLVASSSVMPVTNLEISPAEFQANKGGTTQLSATALSGGQRVTVSPVWSVKQGPATVTEQGLVTVTDYGNVVIQAALGKLTATSTGQAVGKVTISNVPEYIVPGLPYSFTAVAQDSRGQTISVPITWSAVGASIDRLNGRLTGATGNQVTVKATAAGISDEVKVPVLKSITVIPSTTSVLSGRTVRFLAKGVDSTGKQYDIQPRWDRTNPLAGVIGADGSFVGASSGATVVTADLGGLQGRAQVQVAGEPYRLSVTAANTVLPAGAGASTTVKVRLLDQAGNLSPVSDRPITFTISDTGRGSLSRTLALTESGEAVVTYTTGPTSGIASIAVTAPGTNMTGQSLIISTYQPTPTRIELSASPQPLATGSGVAVVTATLRDVNGFPAVAPQNLYVNLTAAGGPVGFLTGNIISIPAGASSGSISFISGLTPGRIQVSGTSTYTVTGITIETATPGSAAKVKIRPIEGTTPVTGLSSLVVKVDVLDAAGVLRANDNTTKVQLTLTGLPNLPEGGSTYTTTAVGGIATFQVPAFSVGTATLTASIADDATAMVDTITTEFVPGVFSSLRLTAQSATLAADGVSQTQIVAEVVDRSGAVVTSINPVVTFRKLTDGGATNPLTDLTVQAVGGRAVLTVQSTRLSASDTWYATASGLDTLNLAVVTSSATSGDAYSLRVTGPTNFSVNSPGTLTVQVVDSQGRLVTTDTGRTVLATYTNANVNLSPAMVTTQNGIATFMVTGTQAGAATVTFSTGGIPVPTTQAVLTFGTQATTGYSLFVASSATTARVGTSVTLTVRVMDSQGVTLSGDTGRTINASVSSGALLSPSSTSTSAGLASFTVTGTAVGSVTVTLNSPGLVQPTAVFTLTFTN